MVGHYLRHIDADIDLVGHADAHQLDVVVKKDEFLAKGYFLFRSFVENEAHDLRQFDDRLLCLFRLNVNQGMDVVERIHQEVGVDLILQVLELLLKVLALELGQTFAIFPMAKIVFGTEVHTNHQQEDDGGSHVVLTDGAMGIAGTAQLWHVIGTVRGDVVGRRHTLMVHGMMHRGTVTFASAMVGLVGTLHHDKHGEEQGYCRAIKQALLSVEEQGSQQVVVDKEGYEKDEILHPDVPQVTPGE